MLMSFEGAPYSVDVIPWVPFANVPMTALGNADHELSVDLVLPIPRPAKPVPAVIYLHGGGWTLGDKAVGMYPFYSPLVAAHGFVGVNMDYRLAWMAPHPAQVDDLATGIAFLRANADRYGIDPDRIGLWGNSAGAHLASLVALREPGLVQAVVAECAPTDFTPQEGTDVDKDNLLALLTGGRPSHSMEIVRELSPIHQARADAPPFFLIHGTEDEIVPFSTIVAFKEALPSTFAAEGRHPRALESVTPGTLDAHGAAQRDRCRRRVRAVSRRP